MKINGIKGLTIAEIQDEVVNGGKFVTYTYCISLIVISINRSSKVYFIKRNESAFVKGLPYTMISLLFGWWGIPWGILYTLRSLFTNSYGGKNLTGSVIKKFQQPTKGFVFEFEPSAALAY